MVRNAAKLEQLLRSQRARIAVAAALIGFSFWAFLPYITSRVASSAFVNAELLRVTAPFNGQVARELPPQGTFIDHPTALRLVDALAPDRRHLSDLEQQAVSAKQHAELARKQLAEIAESSRQQAQRTETYRTAMTGRLQDEIIETEAERTGCLAEMRQRQDVSTRQTDLASRGLALKTQAAQAQAQLETTTAHCAMTAARIERLKIELEAARSGTFVQDGTNDIPYSAQQGDRLLLRQQELETEILGQELQVTELVTQIADERTRVERLAHYDLTLPSDYVVWTLGASPASTVTEGQTILDLADCSHRFVAVELPERDFETITAGELAAVRLLGGDSWMNGRVRQVRGSAAQVDKRLHAAEVPDPHSGSITIEVELPPEPLANGQNNFCDIGRLAEVRFRRLGFNFGDAIGDALRWLSEIVGKGARQFVSLDL